MVETDLKFNDAALNTWSDEDRFEVTGDGIVHYAKATNDPIPAHLAGDVAPPVFGIVPVFESMLVPAVEVVPVELIPRVVHGEQDFHFHRAIRPGDKLVSRAKMIGYEGLEKGTRAAILVEAARKTANWSTSSTSPASSVGIDAGVKVRRTLADPQDTTKHCMARRRCRR